MEKFEALFGIKRHQVQKNCILLPVIPKGFLDRLGVKQLHRGKLYSTVNIGGYTVIRSGIGSSFSADAALYLEDTACRNAVLFGSCGLIQERKDLKIGDLVSPLSSVSNESFSELLIKKKINSKVYYPDKGLLNKFLNFCPDIKQARAVTFASLKLEEDFAGQFVNSKIDVIDMESSAFFAAAKKTGIKGLALFYITDIIKNKPFYLDLEVSLKEKIGAAIGNGQRILGDFLSGL